MLRLLEHVCLWVDPLKDAAGSPFGKADRLYLYLHVQKLCVEWGRALGFLNRIDPSVSVSVIKHMHLTNDAVYQEGSMHLINKKHLITRCT